MTLHDSNIIGQPKGGITRTSGEKLAKLCMQRLFMSGLKTCKVHMNAMINGWQERKQGRVKYCLTL